MRKLIFFPFFKTQKEIFLDNASTSLKFKRVIKSIYNGYRNFSFNPHSFSVNNNQILIKKIVLETREKLANFINCDKKNVFFVPSASYSLNFLALSFSKTYSFSKRSILLTKTDHSSNIYPWVALVKNEKFNANISYVNIKKSFSIDEKDLQTKISKETKIFSFCHVSNSTGARNDIKELVSIVRKVSPECIIIVDGSQSISSEKPNFKEWDIDVFLFSCHKFYSSSGLGIIAMSKRAKDFFPEIFWGGGKSFNENREKDKFFEVGTLPVAEIFGLHEAISIIETLDLKSLSLKRKKIRSYALRELKKIDKVEIYNEKISDSIILFNVNGFHSQDVASFLAKKSIYTRAGNFCSPFIEEIIGIKSAVRVSIALYNNKNEIKYFLEVLKNISLDNIV